MVILLKQFKPGDDFFCVCVFLPFTVSDPDKTDHHICVKTCAGYAFVTISISFRFQFVKAL